LIAYSTAPNTTAEDGEGSNSPYTLSLCRILKEENIPIEQIFKKVRKNVIELTNGKF
jgi:uncharacterized caspase-like protein